MTCLVVRIALKPQASNNRGEDDMTGFFNDKTFSCFFRPVVLCAAFCVASSPVTLSYASGKKIKARDAERFFQVVSSVEADVGNVETALKRADAEIESLVAVTNYFPVERRLLDADLYFESGDYERAATLYKDALDKISRKNSIEYFGTAFRLGESLYRSRNLIAARVYFMLAANPAAGADYGRAVARLFESSVAINDFSGAEKWSAKIDSGLLAEPNVLYCYGKFLYHQGNNSKAYKVFSSIADGSLDFGRARYFMGVIDAEAGRLDESWAGFAAAARTQGTDQTTIDVRGRALLAQAKILFLQARYDEALLSLQQIEQSSSSFFDSLYDSAWVHVKVGDLKNAVYVLNILVMRLEPGDLSLRAAALRGRIMSRLGDIDGAEGAYRDISSVLTPVVKELDTVAASRSSLSEYFDYMTVNDNEAFKVRVPLSEKTTKWLENDGGMHSVGVLFKDLKTEKEDVRQSFEIVGRLLYTLQSGGAIETFPVLKQKYLYLKSSEGSLLEAAVRLAVELEPIVSRALTGEALAQYQAAVKSRQQAYKKFQEGPIKLSEYLARDKAVGEDMQVMERQLFMIDAVLNIEYQQIRGIDEWIREQKARQDVTLSAEKEKLIRSEMETVRNALSDLGVEAAKLKNAVTKASSVRNSPMALKNADMARELLMKALVFEAGVLAEKGASVDKDAGKFMSEASRVIGKAVSAADSTRKVVGRLLKVVDSGAAALEKSVLGEKAELERMVAEVQRVEMDSRRFSETEGYRLFESVRQRIAGVLLEADLGVVDVAWERQQRARQKLKVLNEKRAAKMKSLGVLEQAYNKENQRDSKKAGESPE